MRYNRSVAPSSQQVDPKNPDDVTGGEMSLTEHLAELRARLIKISVVVVVAMAASFWFIRDIIGALSAIAPEYQLQAIDPTEVFSTYLKVAFICGIALAMPVIVYQLFAFMSPGLTRRERNYVLKALPFVMLMFASGVAFGYFVALPRAIDFLLGLGEATVEVRPRLSTYANFVINLLLWLGVAFQTPVIVYLLIKARIVSYRRLASWRRYAIVVIVVAAAIITPTPDPGNMLIVAVPMYLLYELGILLGRIA